MVHSLWTNFRFSALVGPPFENGMTWSNSTSLSATGSKHVPQAREQVRALLGDIWLKPTKEGHLEATLTGRY